MCIYSIPTKRPAKLGLSASPYQKSQLTILLPCLFDAFALRKSSSALSDRLLKIALSKIAFIGGGSIVRGVPGYLTKMISHLGLILCIYKYYVRPVYIQFPWYGSYTELPRFRRSLILKAPFHRAISLE